MLLAGTEDKIIIIIDLVEAKALHESVKWELGNLKNAILQGMGEDEVADELAVMRQLDKGLPDLVEQLETQYEGRD